MSAGNGEPPPKRQRQSNEEEQAGGPQNQISVMQPQPSNGQTQQKPTSDGFPGDSLARCLRVVENMLRHAYAPQFNQAMPQTNIMTIYVSGRIAQKCVCWLAQLQ